MIQFNRNTRILAGRLFIGAACFALAAPASGALLIHYKFDESPSGNTTAIDSSPGGTHTGTFNSTPTRDAGDKPAIASNTSSTQLPSASSKVSTPHAADLVLLRSFTAAMWVKDAPAGNIDPRLAEKSPGNTSGWLVTFNPASKNMQLYFRNAVPFIASSYASKTLTGWHHWAVVYDGTHGGNDGNGTASFYFDGTLLSTGVYALGDMTANDGASLNVGNDPSGIRGLTNKIDDFRFYGSSTDNTGALTQSQILDIIAVPEPASVSLLALGAAMLCRPAPKRRR